MDGAYGGSVSSTLSEIFDTVASSSSIDFEGNSVERYTKKVFGNLVWSIKTRSYGQEVLRLCHLLRVAACCGPEGGYFEILFPMDPIRPGVLRRLLQPYRTRLQPAGIEDGAKGVSLKYPDGGFELSHGSAPNMLVLFEFLCVALGFDRFDEITDRLAGPDVRAADVEDAANDLQKTLYAWLSDHLPPVQIHRKNKLLSRFMRAEKGDDFGIDDLDDSAVLTFWLRFSSDTSANFRMYCSVFAGFRQLRRDLSDDAEASSFRRAISTFRSGGAGGDQEEIDIVTQLYAAPSEDVFPDEARNVSSGFEALAGVTVDEAQLSSPIGNLESEEFSRVKFLTAKDRDLVRDLVDDPFAVDQLPLSTLRTETFGRGQNILKEGKGGGSVRICDALDRATGRNYRDLLEEFRTVRERLDATFHASIFVLQRAGGGTKAEDANVTRVDFDVMARARKGFERVNRAGFRQADIEDDGVVEIHERAVDDLHRVAESLDRIIRVWERHLGQKPDEIFAPDRDIFFNQFKILYGENS